METNNINIENINWEDLWREKLEKKDDRRKNWDKIAPTFNKSAKRDDYHKLIVKQLNLTPKTTVLDLGCGDGSITIPIAKQAKQVTGIDSSKEMLKILNKRCEEEKINNINTIKMDIENIKQEKLGEYDIVLASRSLNNIMNIGEVIDEITKIAKEKVYVTVFGPNNWRIEKEFYQTIGKQYNAFPTHDYLFNILFQKKISPDIKNLNIGSKRQYDSLEDAYQYGKWRKEALNEKEKEQLKEYIKKVMIKNEETGRYSSKHDKSDWILFTWSKN